MIYKLNKHIVPLKRGIKIQRERESAALSADRMQTLVMYVLTAHVERCALNIAGNVLMALAGAVMFSVRFV